ncbi:MAG TPA: hypothetical protein VNA25_30225 [Phycisphaerae bacterium]|nr:hypothetical protein [Phycisphaerae bacterium]
MRIVLLQSVMALGGVEQHMLYLGRALRWRGLHNDMREEGVICSS